MNKPKEVIIIGAGLGSLATALRLTTKGFKVHIIEKYHQAGGRLNQLVKDGFTFDVGPSFFSMSYEFKELFDYCGIQNPIQFKELDPIYTVNFSNGKNYRIFKDLKKLAEEFKEEKDFEKKATAFLKKASTKFHDTENRIVKQNFEGKFDYLRKMSGVPLKHIPSLYKSMWTELSEAFETEDVKVVFSLVGFFLGNTPFQTPAIYTLLNYTELQHDGYWNVKGGMYAIVTEMMKLLEQRGVKFSFNTEITEVIEDRNIISGIKDSRGNTYSADYYISNSDAATFRGQYLKRKAFTEAKLDKMEWTLAPFTIYLGVKGKVPNIAHHSYFLGTNFKDYSDKIFKTSVKPDKPYYYVNVPSKSEPECAPEGCESLFILCPVPDMRYKSDWSDSEILADEIIADLSRRVGYDLNANTITRTIWSPVDWRDKFNLYKGSGLGLGHGIMQIGGLRPANKDEKISNLYYVGASTIPGTGLPMVVIGSRLVTERILNDSKVKFQPATS